MALATVDHGASHGLEHRGLPRPRQELRDLSQQADRSPLSRILRHFLFVAIRCDSEVI